MPTGLHCALFIALHVQQWNSFEPSTNQMKKRRTYFEGLLEDKARGAQPSIFGAMKEKEPQTKWFLSFKNGSSTRMTPLHVRNCWTMSITTLIGRLLIQLIGHTLNPLVVGQRGETAESLGWLKLPWPCFWERLWWPNLGWSAGGYATYQATVPW